MDLITKYFPDLTDLQSENFAQLGQLYREWNDKINVVSRKDIDSIYERHILHSLAIAKVISFKPGTSVMDVGTGGGLPGVPLAILFPEVSFYLVDSIGKKIRVVKELSESLDLNNVRAEQKRAEEVKEKFDFVVSRAVTAMPRFVSWVEKTIKPIDHNALPNGILALKGGDLEEELQMYQGKILGYNIADFFDEPFYETKKVIYLPL